MHRRGQENENNNLLRMLRHRAGLTVTDGVAERVIAAETGIRGINHFAVRDHCAAVARLGDFDLVCLDDADHVAGEADWERALLQLFEALRARRARLVVSALRAPLHAGFQLPDLASRWTSGATFRVRSLDDEQKQAALQRRAAWRGLDLPDDAARYLLTHATRGTAALFALLDRLDSESLVAQKRLTVPFVRRVLDEAAPKS